MTPWHAMPTASSSPVLQRTLSTCSRPTFPGSSPPATSAPGPRSVAPLRSAKEQWPCSSSTPTFPAAPRRSERDDQRHVHPPRPDHPPRSARHGGRLRGLPANRREVATPPDLLDLRACRVL